MDIIWIVVAFSCGYLAKLAKLPPLVGYLAAGFGLHSIGFVIAGSVEALASIGVTLLLFTIGLKLDVKSLLKPEVWAGASGHMSLIVVLTIGNSLFLGILGFAYFSELDWQAAALLGFAVSFSSTVFAVKVLEERAEIKARHGQVAIGILIIQDIAAVLFVTFATDKSPSVWALSLIFFPLVKPLLNALINRCGHGELLPLSGFFLAVTAGKLFEHVGLESHLGALVIGALLSSHEKANELAKSLLNFKDLFLIGFFLSIGFTALPTVDMLVAALIMTIALPIKAGLLFVWLTQLKLRSRSSFLAALSLANYSEFGLIVCSVSVANGLLPKEWLVIMALAVALSFIFSSVLNLRAHSLNLKWEDFLKRFERDKRLPEDEFSQPSDATVFVIGMGRVGTGAYELLEERLSDIICGLDVDKLRVEKHTKKGRFVIEADAEDPEFWKVINLKPIKLIMLAMPNHRDILEIAHQLEAAGFTGKTAGIARYKDEEKELKEAGIDVVFNFYSKAGSGFAEQSIHLIQ